MSFFSDDEIIHYMADRFTTRNSSSGPMVNLAQLQEERIYNQWLIAQYEELLSGNGRPVFASGHLARTWKSTNTLPSQLHLPGVQDMSPYPFVMTASSNISRAMMDNDLVALKTFRQTLTQPGSDEDYMRFFFEALVLPTELHPNILPVLGVHVGQSGGIYLVSKFMKNGPLPNYLASHPEVDKLHILTQLADALVFLHGLPQPILHGDIRGFNILVDDTGEPLLMDFGFALMFNPASSQFEPQCHAHVGNARWTSPEKLRQSEHPLTLKADCFSFASLMLEVLSGDIPYCHLPNDGAVVVEVMLRNKLPQRPSSVTITDSLWALMEKCWSVDPAKRPSMVEIRDFLASLRCDSPSRS